LGNGETLILELALFSPVELRFESPLIDNVSW
jgi:hypothetical protein